MSHRNTITPPGTFSVSDNAELQLFHKITKGGMPVMFKKMNATALMVGACIMVLIFSSAALAVEVYFNNFEGTPPWTEWSLGGKATTPTGRNFLGADSYFRTMGSAIKPPPSG